MQSHLFPTANCGLQLAFGHRDDIEKDLVFPNPLDFSPSDVADKYLPECNRIFDDGNIPVVSHERLSGNPHSGGYDSKELADRIYASMPYAKILIVVREQLSMIKSCYRQYLKEGGGCNVQDYLQPPKRGKGRIPLFNFQYFFYHRLTGYYQRLFGYDNVLVLPHELLLTDGMEFVSRVLDFAEAGQTSDVVKYLPFNDNVNLARSPMHLLLTKPLNRIFTRDTLDPKVLVRSAVLKDFSMRAAENIARMTPKFFQDRIDRAWSEKVAQIAGDRFTDSNQQLETLTGLSLSQYGYQL